jgi:WD40 repeat protein
MRRLRKQLTKMLLGPALVLLSLPGCGRKPKMDGPEHFRLMEPDQGRVVLALSADGRWVADGEEPHLMWRGSVTVWDRYSREIVCFKRIRDGEEVTAVAFSPDGSMMAALTTMDLTGGDTTRITLWDTRTWKERGRLSWKGRWARRVVFHPHLPRLFVGGGEGDNLRVWDYAIGKLLYTRKAAESPDSMALSPDGRLLVTGSGRIVEVWDAESGVLMWSFEALPAPPKDKWPHHEPIYVRGVAFLADNRRFATVGGEDLEQVHLWDIGAQKEIGVLRCKNVGLASFVGVSADGKLLIVAGQEGPHSRTSSVEVWNLPERRRRGSFTIKDSRKIEARLSADGRWLATWTEPNGGLQVWDLSTLPAGNEDE